MRRSIQSNRRVYEVHGKMPLVCKLKKGLYGVKQNFDAFMRSQSYDRSNEGSC